MLHAMLRAAAAAGGFDPLSIAWRNAFWTEGESFIALGLPDGASVATWPDEVGTDDVSQGTASLQPEYHASLAGLNGRPGITGDTVDDYLRASSSPDFNGPNTIVMVGYVPDVANEYRPVTLSDNEVNVGPILSSGPTNWRVYGGDWLEDGTTDTNGHIIIATVDGASSEIMVDGTATSGSAGTTNNDAAGITLFANRTLANNGGTMAFVGIKSGTLTAQEKSDLTAWAADTYGLTIT